MLIKRAELMNALSSVKPGLAFNTIVKQMESVQFSGQDLVTYNEQIGVLVPFETDFTAAVNYTDLVQIISKLDEEDIEINLQEDELSISTEKTKAGLFVIDTGDLQENINAMINQMPNEENGVEWDELPSDFLTGVSLCTPAAEKNISKGTLACMHTNGTHVFCSDNIRVAVFKLSTDIGKSFMLHAGLISELSKFDVKHFCISDSWAHFLTEDSTVFSVKRIRGESMDFYLDLLDGFKGKAIPIPDGLKEIVNAASVMSANDDQKPMKLTLKDGEMICETHNERGWVEKRVEVDGAKKSNMEMTISALYLQYILELPNVQMISGDGKSFFESGQFKYILLHRSDD